MERKCFARLTFVEAYVENLSPIALEMSIVIGIVSVMGMVVANAAVLFYWGGKISKAIDLLEKMSSDHEERLRTLEHD